MSATATVLDGQVPTWDAGAGQYIPQSPASTLSDARYVIKEAGAGTQVMLNALAVPADSFVVGTNQIVAASGVVAIGTSVNGSYKLNVGGIVNATDFYKNGAPFSATTQWVDHANGIYYSANNVGIGGTPSATYDLNVTGSVNAANYFQGGVALATSPWLSNANGIHYTAGNVGIGTILPTRKVQLESATNLYFSLISPTSAQILFGPSSGNDDEGMIQYSTTIHYFSIWAFDAEVARIGHGGYAATFFGDVNITGVYRINGNAIGASLWVYDGDGIYHQPDDGPVRIGDPSSGPPSAVNVNLALYPHPLSPSVGRGILIEMATDSSIYFGHSTTTENDAHITSTLTEFEIGTTDSTPVIFITEDSPRVVVDSSGRVNFGSATSFLNDFQIIRPASDLEILWECEDSLEIIWRETGEDNIVRLQMLTTHADLVMAAIETEAFIGTLNAYPFHFLTNNITRMQIDNAGLIGINTAPLTYRVNINGSINATAYFLNGSAFSGGGGGQWTTNGTTIYYSTGFVGIGVNPPLYSLHIKDTDSDVNLFVESTFASANSTLILSTTGSVLYARAGAAYAEFGTTTNHGLVFMVDEVVAMHLDTSRHLGINCTASAGYFLEVNGDINCTGIFVAGVEITGGGGSSQWLDDGTGISYTGNHVVLGNYEPVEATDQVFVAMGFHGADAIDDFGGDGQGASIVGGNGGNVDTGLDGYNSGAGGGIVIMGGNGGIGTNAANGGIGGDVQISAGFGGAGGAGGGSAGSNGIISLIGLTGISTATPSLTNGTGTGVDVNANTIRLRNIRTPASSTASGNRGEFCYDANYFYMCTSTNVWKRIAWTTF